MIWLVDANFWKTQKVNKVNVSLGLALPRPNYVEKFRVCRVDVYLLKKVSTSNSPKNWSEWNNSKHFTDYSRNSGTGKFVRYTIAALLFVPIGFLAYMTTI